MESKQIYARFILEILGAPKEYIEQTLKEYVAKLKKEGVEIKKEKFEEAKPADKLFSTFAEIEAQFQDINDLLSFCFEALPSSVEIIEPLELKINAPQLTGFLNDLQARLHEADLIIKSTEAHNKILDLNATAVFNNFVTHLLKQGPKTEQELAEETGTTAKELKPFLKKLEQNNKIKFDGTIYTT